MTGTQYRAILVRDDIATKVEQVARDLEAGAGESESDRGIDELKQYALDVEPDGDKREIVDRSSNANGDETTGDTGKVGRTPMGGRP